MLESRFDEAALADEQTKAYIIRELASYPDGLNTAISMLKTAAKRRWGG